MEVRPERAEDVEGIRRVVRAAFARDQEAALVDALRRGAGRFVSLVATDDGRVVGHILFTEVEIGNAGGGLALGLAPMAVLPDVQRGGIGSKLVEAGLDACRAEGAELVVVLGHPEYYPRFGFVPADELGLSYPDPVPREVFMAQRLVPASSHSGTVRYRAEFEDVADDG